MTPPYAAELRVYEPLSAFPADERRRWEDYARTSAAATTREGARREWQIGLLAACRAVPRVPRPGELGEDAYLLRSDAGSLVCPWRTELRSWSAVSELGDVLPAELAESVLPAEEREFAAEAQERWLADHPRLRAHILTSRWVVPVRWFLLFDREERRLQLGPRHAAGSAAGSGGDPPGGSIGSPATARGQATTLSRSLVYRTPMVQARRRVARAIAALRRAFDMQPVVVAVESLGRWLEEFHPRSVLELDYGGIVDLREDDELRADDSAGDVAEALAALAQGDVSAAGAAYDRVIERWRIAHRVESAN